MKEKSVVNTQVECVCVSPEIDKLQLTTLSDLFVFVYPCSLFLSLHLDLS